MDAGVRREGGVVIHYRDGYRYQLARPFACATPFRPAGLVKGAYRILYPTGRLLIRKGYAWDGPSGPSVDTKSFMRGSLVHDALYQFLREGKVLHMEPNEPGGLVDTQFLNPDGWREIADNLLHEHCREDGMSRIRAWFVLRVVRRFAGDAAKPAEKKKVLTA